MSAINPGIYLEVFRCPIDRATLFYSEDHLVCQTCQVKYPFIDGIISFVSAIAPSSTGIDAEKKTAEIKARDLAAPIYESAFGHHRNQTEIPQYLQAMNLKDDDKVVELGCGTGRITREYVSRVDLVIAIDFSIESLKILQKSFVESGVRNCILVHADISKLPLRSHYFTRAVSFQVLEHLPSEESRFGAIKEAKRVLVSGCPLILSAYHWSDLKKKNRDQPGCSKEGFHEIYGNSVYYYNFETHEFADLFSRAGFRTEFIKGIQMHIRGIARLGRLGRAIDRLISKTPFGIKFGHLLMGKATAI